MKLLVISLCILVSACTTMSDLARPSSEKHFVLSNDIYKTDVRGVYRWKWAIGLRKGKYTLVGEDKDGYYFKGEGDAVFFLSQERAEKYLATGEIAPYAERYKPQLSMAGGEGGLWLPKEGVAKEPRLFFVVTTNPNDAFIAGTYAGGVAGDGAQVGPVTGMAIGAATTTTISSLVDNTLGYEKFGAALAGAPKIVVVDGP